MQFGDVGTVSTGVVIGTAVAATALAVAAAVGGAKAWARVCHVAAVACFVAAGSLVAERLLGSFRPADRPLPWWLAMVALLGAATAAAGLIVHATPGPAWHLAAGITAGVAGLLVVAGSLLPWTSGRRAARIPSFELDTRWWVLVLGVGLAASAAGLAARSSLRTISTAAAAGALLVGTSVAAIAFASGSHLDGLRISAGVGLHLVLVAGVVAAGVGAWQLLAANGLREPRYPIWVAAVYAAIGIFGLVLASSMTEELQDRDASVFLFRAMASMLLVIGAGLAARLAWAWLLAFVVSAAGIANAGLSIVVGGAVRGFGFLALVVYFNALRALWNARGTTVRPITPPPAAPVATPAIEASQARRPAPVLLLVLGGAVLILAGLVAGLAVSALQDNDDDRDLPARDVAARSSSSLPMYSPRSVSTVPEFIGPVEPHDLAGCLEERGLRVETVTSSSGAMVVLVHHDAAEPLPVIVYASPEVARAAYNRFEGELQEGQGVSISRNVVTAYEAATTPESLRDTIRECIAESG